MNDSTPMDSTPADQSPGTQRGRWSKILIIATILVPMVLAYVIYHTGMLMPQGTVNKGDLLSPPVQISNISLATDGAPIQFESQARKWRLVVPAFSECTKACEQALYLTRQVHKRLNNKYPRVERWVLTDIETPLFADLLASEYSGAEVVQASHGQWLSLINQSDQPAGHFYMMDQKGFIMMAYNVERHSGNDLLTDIKKMLKYTREH